MQRADCLGVTGTLGRRGHLLAEDEVKFAIFDLFVCLRPQVDQRALELLADGRLERSVQTRSEVVAGLVRMTRRCARDYRLIQILTPPMVLSSLLMVFPSRLRLVLPWNLG